MAPNERLRRAREDRHWTQADLARRVGIASATVSRWELGIQVPGPHFREKLCDLFRLSPGELGLGPEGSPAPPDARVVLPVAEYHARRDVLAQMRRYWIETELEAAIGPLPRIRLALVERAGAVDDPMRVQRRGGAVDRPLGDDAAIEAIYRRLGEQVLVLGEPGAGKTVLLLTLARSLLAEAEGRPAAPVPVIFHLSSWAAERQSFAHWLVDELHKRYGVAQRLGRAWVEQERVLPLLDGLDEVAHTHRPACIAAINAFRREHGQLPMVVCCRTTDYEEARTPLTLRSAIAIQPVGPADLDRTVTGDDEPLAGLRAVRRDEQLRELLTTPLLVSMVAVTYRDQPVSTVPAETLEERRRRVLADYVAGMLRRAAPAAHSPAATIAWLTWLARAMRTHDQGVFSLDWIQPDWLPGRWRPLAATLGVAAGAAVAAALAGGGLVGLVAAVLLGPGQGLASALATALILAVAVGVSAYSRGIAPTEQLRWSWATLRRRVSRLMPASVVCGMTVGLVLGVGGGQDAGPAAALIVGLGSAAGTPLVGGLDAPLYRRPSDPGQGIQASLRTALVTGGLALLLTFAGQVVAAVLTPVAASGALVIIGLGVGLGIGVIPLPARVSGAVPTRWSWRALATRLPTALLSGFAGAFVTALLVGLTLGLMGGPRPGVAGGLAAGVWGLAAGFGAGLVYGSVGGPVAGWLVAIVIEPIADIPTTLVMALVTGLVAALVAGLLRGGGAYLRHHAVRLLLARDGSAPRDYAAFLAYACRETLLRRAGGGYQFAHRLLLDYFADLGAA